MSDPFINSERNVLLRELIGGFHLKSADFVLTADGGPDVILNGEVDQMSRF